MTYMSSLHHHLRKVCVLAAVAFILPALAYAGHDNDKDKKGENDGKENDKGDSKFLSFPRQTQRGS